MKTTVKPVLDKYRGVSNTGSHDAVLTLGLETITTGMLWWKKVVYNDVWCICGTELIPWDWDYEHYWKVLRYFPYEDKEVAIKYLKDLREE